MKRIILVGLALASPALASFADRYPERAATRCEHEEMLADWAAKHRKNGEPMTVPMREAVALPNPTTRHRFIAMIRRAYAEVPRPEPEHPTLLTWAREVDDEHIRRFKERVVSGCWSNMVRD